MWWKYISIIVIAIAVFQYWYMNWQMSNLNWRLKEMTKAYLALELEHKRYVRKRNTKGQFVKNNLDK
jgi:hypothetical protein